FSSECKLAGTDIEHDLLLLPDALVQRIHIAGNSRKVKAGIGMLHQEAISADGGSRRTWSDMVFDPTVNAFIWSATALNPTPKPQKPEEESLAQRGLGVIVDAPKATTWIGLGSDHKISTHCGHHPRSKHYIHSNGLKGADGAYFLVFAPTRAALIKRL